MLDAQLVEERTARIDRRARAGGRLKQNDPAEALDTVASSVGRPLPRGLQRQLEKALGVSLDGVRVHTGARSDAAARQVKAEAFTVGQDIHFAAGRFDPSSRAGRELLAHEVYHTVEQRAATGSGRVEVSQPGDAHEVAADEFAGLFAKNEHAGVLPDAAPARPAVASHGAVRIDRQASDAAEESEEASAEGSAADDYIEIDDASAIDRETVDAALTRKFKLEDPVFQAQLRSPELDQQFSQPVDELPGKQLSATDQGEAEGAAPGTGGATGEAPAAANAQDEELARLEQGMAELDRLNQELDQALEQRDQEPEQSEETTDEVDEAGESDAAAESAEGAQDAEPAASPDDEQAEPSSDVQDGEQGETSSDVQDGEQGETSSDVQDGEQAAAPASEAPGDTPPEAAQGTDTSAEGATATGTGRDEEAAEPSAEASVEASVEAPAPAVTPDRAQPPAAAVPQGDAGQQAALFRPQPRQEQQQGEETARSAASRSDAHASQGRAGQEMSTAALSAASDRRVALAPVASTTLEREEGAEIPEIVVQPDIDLEESYPGRGTLDEVEMPTVESAASAAGVDLAQVSDMAATVQADPAVTRATAQVEAAAQEVLGARGAAASAAPAATPAATGIESGESPFLQVTAARREQVASGLAVHAVQPVAMPASPHLPEVTATAVQGQVPADVVVDTQRQPIDPQVVPPGVMPATPAPPTVSVSAATQTPQVAAPTVPDVRRPDSDGIPHPSSLVTSTIKLSSDRQAHQSALATEAATRSVVAEVESVERAARIEPLPEQASALFVATTEAPHAAIVAGEQAGREHAAQVASAGQQAQAQVHADNAARRAALAEADRQLGPSQPAPPALAAGAAAADGFTTAAAALSEGLTATPQGTFVAPAGTATLIAQVRGLTPPAPPAPPPTPEVRRPEPPAREIPADATRSAETRALAERVAGTPLPAIEFDAPASQPGGVDPRRDEAVAEVEQGLAQAFRAQATPAMEEAAAPVRQEMTGELDQVQADAQAQLADAEAQAQAVETEVLTSVPPIGAAEIEAEVAASWDGYDATSQAATRQAGEDVTAAEAQAQQSQVEADQQHQQSVAQAQAQHASETTAAESTHQDAVAQAEAAHEAAQAQAQAQLEAEQAQAEATAQQRKAEAETQTQATIAQAHAQHEVEVQAAEQQYQTEAEAVKEHERTESARLQAESDTRVQQARSDLDTESQRLESQGKVESDRLLAQGESQYQEEINRGQSKADAERRRAEAEAAAKKKEADEKSKKKGGFFRRLLRKIKNAIKKLINMVADILRRARDAVVNIMKAARAAALRALRRMRDLARAAIEKVKGLIQSAIAAVAKAVRDIIAKAAEAIKAVIQAAAHALKSLVQKLTEVINGLIEVLQTVINKALDALTAIVSLINEDWGKALAEATAKFREAFNAAVDRLQADIQAASDALQAAIDQAAATLSAAVDAAAEALQSAVTALEQVLHEAVELAFSAAAAAIDAAFALAEAAVNAIFDAAEAMITAFFDAAIAALEVAAFLVEQVMDLVIEMVGWAINAISEAFSALVDLLPDVIIEGIIDFWNGPWREAIVLGLVTIAAVAITVATLGAGAPVGAMMVTAALVGGAMAGSVYFAGEMVARHGAVELYERNQQIYVPNHGYIDVEIDPATGQPVRPEGVSEAYWQWALSNFYIDADGTITAKSNEELFDYAALEGAEGFIAGAVSSAAAAAGGALGARAAGALASRGVGLATQAVVSAGVEAALDVAGSTIVAGATTVLHALAEGESLRDALSAGFQAAAGELTPEVLVMSVLTMGVAGSNARWVNDVIDARFVNDLSNAAANVTWDTATEVLAEAGAGFSVVFFEALADGVPLDQAAQRATSAAGEAFDPRKIVLAAGLTSFGQMVETPDADGADADGSEAGSTPEAGTPGQIAFAQAANQPVGPPLATSAEAAGIVRALADGDVDALTGMGVEVPPDFDARSIEWGVGERPDGSYVVVKGGGDDIDWSSLGEVTPAAHSHPFRPDRMLEGVDETGTLPFTDLLDPARERDRVVVFPSAQDVNFMVQNGLDSHTVHTPYVYHENGRIGDPVEGHTGRPIDFTISQAETVGSFMGSDSIPVQRSIMEARVDGEVIWRGEVYSTTHPAVGGIEFERPAYMQDKIPTEVSNGQTTEAGQVPVGQDGYDSGYDGDTEDGYDSDGYDSDGYDSDGYDSGYDGDTEDGYDSDSYDSDGYDSDGYDSDTEDGHDSDSDSDSESEGEQQPSQSTAEQQPSSENGATSSQTPDRLPPDTGGASELSSQVLDTIGDVSDFLGNLGTNFGNNMGASTDPVVGQWTDGINDNAQAFLSGMGDLAGGTVQLVDSIGSSLELLRKGTLSGEEQVKLVKSITDSVQGLMVMAGGVSYLSEARFGADTSSNFGLTAEGGNMLSTDFKLAGDIAGQISSVIKLGQDLVTLGKKWNGDDSIDLTYFEIGVQLTSSAAKMGKTLGQLTRQIKDGGQIVHGIGGAAFGPFASHVVPGLGALATGTGMVREAHTVLQARSGRKQLADMLQSPDLPDSQRHAIEFAMAELDKQIKRGQLNLALDTPAFIADVLWATPVVGSGPAVAVGATTGVVKLGAAGRRFGQQRWRDRRAERRQDAGKTESYAEWRKRKQEEGGFKAQMALLTTPNWDKSTGAKIRTYRENAEIILAMENPQIYAILGLDADTLRDAGHEEQIQRVTDALRGHRRKMQVADEQAPPDVDAPDNSGAGELQGQALDTVGDVSDLLGNLGTNFGNNMGASTDPVVARWTQAIQDNPQAVLSGIGDLTGGAAQLVDRIGTSLEKLRKGELSTDDKVELVQSITESVQAAMVMAGGVTYLTEARFDVNTATSFGFTAEGGDMLSTDFKLAGDIAGHIAGVIDTYQRFVELGRRYRDGELTEGTYLEVGGRLVHTLATITRSLGGMAKTLTQLVGQIQGGGQIAAGFGGEAFKTFGGQVVPGLGAVATGTGMIREANIVLQAREKRKKLDDLLQDPDLTDADRQAIEFFRAELDKRIKRGQLNLALDAPALVGNILFATPVVGAAPGVAFGAATGVAKLGAVGRRFGQQRRRDREARRREEEGKTESYADWRRRKQEEGGFKSHMALMFTPDWDKNTGAKIRTYRENAEILLAMDQPQVWEMLGLDRDEILKLDTEEQLQKITNVLRAGRRNLTVKDDDAADSGAADSGAADDDAADDDAADIGAAVDESIARQHNDTDAGASSSDSDLEELESLGAESDASDASDATRFLSSFFSSWSNTGESEKYGDGFISGRDDDSDWRTSDEEGEESTPEESAPGSQTSDSDSDSDSDDELDIFDIDRTRNTGTF